MAAKLCPFASLDMKGCIKEVSDTPYHNQGDDLQYYLEVSMVAINQL